MVQIIINCMYMACEFQLINLLAILKKSAAVTSQIICDITGVHHDIDAATNHQPTRIFLY